MNNAMGPGVVGVGGDRWPPWSMPGVVLNVCQADQRLCLTVRVRVIVFVPRENYCIVLFILRFTFVCVFVLVAYWYGCV